MRTRTWYSAQGPGLMARTPQAGTGDVSRIARGGPNEKPEKFYLHTSLTSECMCGLLLQGKHVWCLKLLSTNVSLVDPSGRDALSISKSSISIKRNLLGWRLRAVFGFVVPSRLSQIVFARTVDIHPTCTCLNNTSVYLPFFPSFCTVFALLSSAGMSMDRCVYVQSEC